MLRCIISGGQTGVDRGALDAARKAGLRRGGWCPRRRKAEDGRIPLRYRLEQTPCTDYEERTIWNVADSDATLVLNRGKLEGGTLYTVDAASSLGRPCLVIQLDGGEGWEDARAQIREWTAHHAVEVLNVAGPRESKSPGIAGEARAFISALLEAGRPS